MLFSSITFLYVFLPLVLLVYFVTPKAFKNLVLFFSSLIFYAWGEPKFVFIMIGEIVLGYVFGLLIEHYQGTFFCKLFLMLSIATSLSALAVFKYADFFIGNFNRVTGMDITLLRLALPIGISFYTFQILSYTVDVYRGNVAAQKNFITLGTYIALFPQLIAGPIVRYSDVEKQLNHRPQDFETVAIGIRRFVLGLGKKVLLANQFGEFCEIFRASDEKSILFYWLYAIAYSMHIYFDFSGYSDMAIGLGKIFGFTFMENFNYPFISGSVTEFWRRWHISLGSWFRDYVYIPLGGNKTSRIKWIRNIFVVWFLTGMWHGASWNFILWGLFFAVFLLIEKLWLLDKLNKTKVLKHLYVLLIIVISFVLFNAVDLSQFVGDLRGLLGIGGLSLTTADSLYYAKDYGVLLLIGAFLSTPCMMKLNQWVRRNTMGNRILEVVEIPFIMILFVAITGYLIDGSFNPFLYFRF